MATVGSIVGGAFGLVRERPGSVAIWGLAYLVGSLVIFGAMALLTGGAVTMMGPVEPDQMPQFGAGIILAGLFTYFLYLLLSIVLINAVYRAILRPNDSALASMRLGGDEFRMLGLTILFAIGMIVAYLISVLGVVLFQLVAGMVMRDVPAVAVGVSVITMLAFMLGWIWLLVRLSLIFPMTFHRRRIAVDEGWALGKGRFWTLFGSYFLVWLIIIVLAVIVFWSNFAGMFEMMRAGGDAGTQEAALERMAAQQGAGGGLTIYFLLTTSIVSLVSFVLGYGVVGSAARELLGEKGEVTEGDAYRTAEIFD